MINELVKELVEAGVHYGHQTKKWNPKMKPYLMKDKGGIYIIDLEKTLRCLDNAATFLTETASKKKKILFVGCKRQAQEAVKEAAEATGQLYVNHRWLGGMMTNWQTISNSIKRLRTLDDQLAGETEGLTKKEILGLTRERDKLDRALGGIKEMGGLPDILFVIDTNKESIAIAEANKLGIPVIGVIDSNSSPEGIDFPIPGNDDAIRAISLYCDLIVGCVFDGLQAEITTTGGDIGEAEEVPQEDLPEASTETATRATEETPATAKSATSTEDAEKAPAE